MFYGAWPEDSEASKCIFQVAIEADQMAFQLYKGGPQNGLGDPPKITGKDGKNHGRS